MLHASLVLLTVAAASPRLIADLNTGASTVAVDGSVVGTVGNLTVFSMATESGREPWVADPAAGTAKLLADLNPGIGDSFPWGLGNLGGRLLFVADDGVHGAELWSTDGTPGGTVLLKDVNPGPAGAIYRRSIILGSTLYFLADDGNQGYTGLALWKSDGTPAGTQLVFEKGGGYGFDPDTRGFVVLGSALYFGAYNEIWKTDGTAAGTERVYAVSQATHTRDVYPFVALGKLWFSSGYNSLYTWDLYVSDGTTAGTRLVGGIAGGAATVNGHLLYSTWSGSNGTYSISLKTNDGTTTTSLGTYTSGGTSVAWVGTDPSWGIGFFATSVSSSGALYVTDGTSSGTSALQSLTGYPSQVVKLGARYYFLGSDSQGAALFTWDGVAAAPSVVRRLGALYTSFAPRVAGNHLFFVASDGVAGLEPWASDGTAAGTVMLADVTAGSAGSLVTRAEVFGDTLLFDGQPSGSWAPTSSWRSDGTPAGTTKLGDFGAPFWAVGASYAFAIGTEPPSATLRVLPLAGAPAAAKQIWTLSPPSSDASNFTAASASLAFFNARETGQTDPNSLFRTDGTPSGTQQLIRIWAQYMSDFEMLGTRLIFLGGGGVWASDGTAANTFSVGGATAKAHLTSAAIVGRSRSSGGYELAATSGTSRTTPYALQSIPSYPTNFVRAGNYVFFLQRPAGYYSDYLYRTDGTSSGLLRLTTVVADQPVAFGSKVGFVVGDSDLWTSDGTLANTAVVAGSEKTKPAELVSAGSTLFFTAEEAATGREVYAYDATGLRRLGDFQPGTGGTKLLAATPQGSGAVLLIQTYSGRFLVRTDGTAGGTTVLGQAPGATWLRTAGDVYLPCAVGAEGLELCALSATAAQPAVVADLNPGPQPSSPEPVVRVGSQLFFTAYTPAAGREPMAIDLAPDTTPPVITPVLTGTLGQSGFYKSNVTVAFTVTDAESAATPGAGCTTSTVTTDTAGKTFTCTATSAGGSATKSVTVKRDATNPVVKCPAAASGVASQPVTFSVTATDAIDPAPVVTAAPPSGSVFPLGQTTVNATATDAAGNQAKCSFVVTTTASGPDAGTSGPDASSAGPDSGTGANPDQPDAGAQPGVDAGAPPDAGAADAGCGCSSGSAAVSANALLALFGLATRRRKAPRP